MVHHRDIMRYYSTKNPDNSVSLYEAVTHSTAPDSGVYIPESIPDIPRALFNNISEMTLAEIAYVVGSVLFGSDIDPAKINDIVKDTLSFDIPLVKIDNNIYALELFHGPTKSFKDIGTRFMAHLLDYFRTTDTGAINGLNVLVTTSGDTGCAVVDAFGGLSDVRVFVLSPKGTLRHVYGDRIHSLPSNIVPVEVRGDFDTCMEMARKAYNDRELNRHLSLTSANSINIARLLPQTFFFFHAYARLVAAGENPERIAVATPCGNLGNFTAALYAKRMGLPISRIMATGYGNERLWRHLNGGISTLKDTDVRNLGNNPARINRILSEMPELSTLVDCHTFSEQDVASQIRDTYNRSGYLMDRNSAMACRALYENMHFGETGVFMATAHPMKYADKLEQILGKPLMLSPHKSQNDSMQHRNLPHITTISPTFPALKNLLLEYSSNTK